MRYSHAFDIAFEVVTDHAAARVTAREIRAALQRRIDGLADDELLEAVGLPFDSYPLTDVAPTKPP
jgi:hypothetical protein